MKILLTLFIMLTHLIGEGVADAEVYLTRENALSKAFPGASEVEKKTLFISMEEQKRIEELAKGKLDSRMITFYVGKRDGKVIEYAYLGSHVIRTKLAVFMVVINPNKTVKSVEVLAFYEPEEYLPTHGWFAQFSGKVLDNRLWPKRDIHAVTGATMSVYSITMEVRKVLAIYEVVSSRI